MFTRIRPLISIALQTAMLLGLGVLNVGMANAADTTQLKFLLELRGVRYKKEIKVAANGKFEWRVSPRDSAPVHFKGRVVRPSGRGPASVNNAVKVKLKAIDMRGFTYVKMLEKQGRVSEKKPWAFRFRDPKNPTGKLAVVVVD